MSQSLNSAVAVIGIDIGKNSFHVVGLDDRGAIVLRQKWSLRLLVNLLVGISHCSFPPKVLNRVGDSSYSEPLSTLRQPGGPRGK
jgi:hypothetical protein